MGLSGDLEEEVGGVGAVTHPLLAALHLPEVLLGTHAPDHPGLLAGAPNFDLK